MIRRRIGWALWLIAAGVLYFFENNTATRSLLAASVLAEGDGTLASGDYQYVLQPDGTAKITSYTGAPVIRLAARHPRNRPGTAAPGREGRRAASGPGGSAAQRGSPPGSGR